MKTIQIVAKLYNQGFTLKTIAEKTGVSVDTVRNYLIRVDLKKKKKDEKRSVCGCGEPIETHKKCSSCGAFWHRDTRGTFIKTIEQNGKYYCKECVWQKRNYI